MSKICKTCQIEKIISEFHVLNKGTYINSNCKLCHNLKVKINSKKRRNNFTEILKDRKKCKKYRDIKGPEYMRAIYKKSYKKNIENRIADRLSRRALGSISGTIIKEILNLYNNKCAYCNNIGKHIDHFIPISRGGTNNINNLVLSCQNCNLSKHNKYFLNFIWEKLKI